MLDDLEALASPLASQLGERAHRAPAGLLPDLIGQLGFLGRLRAEPGQESRLRSLQAAIAVQAAWLCYLLDSRRDARRLYRFARQTAAAAGDASLQAHALTGLTLLYSGGSRSPAAGASRLVLDMLGEAARLVGPQTSPVLRSWIHEQMATEHAMAGEAGAVARDVAVAAAVISRTSGRERELEEAWFASYRGGAALALHQAAEAVPLLEAALAGFGPELVTGRSLALIHLGAAHAEQGEPEQACRRLGEALALAAQHELGNRIHRVLGVRRERLARWAAEPAVRALDEQLAALSR